MESIELLCIDDVLEIHKEDAAAICSEPTSDAVGATKIVCMGYLPTIIMLKHPSDKNDVFLSALRNFRR